MLFLIAIIKAPLLIYYVVVVDSESNQNISGAAFSTFISTPGKGYYFFIIFILELQTENDNYDVLSEYHISVCFLF